MIVPSQVFSTTYSNLFSSILNPFSNPFTMNMRNEPLHDVACVIKRGVPPGWRWKPRESRDIQILFQREQIQSCGGGPHSKLDVFPDQMKVKWNKFPPSACQSNSPKSFWSNPRPRCDNKGKDKFKFVKLVGKCWKDNGFVFGCGWDEYKCRQRMTRCFFTLSKWRNKNVGRKENVRRE